MIYTYKHCHSAEYKAKLTTGVSQTNFKFTLTFLISTNLLELVEVKDKQKHPIYVAI